MKSYEKIMTIPDLLDSMDTNYYSRPIYELINLLKKMFSYVRRLC